ncbi:12748_t:CDS:2, partial [Dentiscutata erythropus]
KNSNVKIWIPLAALSLLYVVATIRIKRSKIEEERVCRLEEQIKSRDVDGGGYNRETTQVLELKDNPAAKDYAIRQSNLDELKAVNERLLLKLEYLRKKAKRHT